MALWSAVGSEATWPVRCDSVVSVPQCPLSLRGRDHVAVHEPSTGSSCCVFAQSHLAVLAVGHPLAPSVSSSLASSLASSTGSGGSSPTALPALSARTHPLDPSGSAGEGVPGKPGALLPLCTCLDTFRCTRVCARSFAEERFRWSSATPAVLPRESAYLAGRHKRQRGYGALWRARAAAPPRARGFREMTGACRFDGDQGGERKASLAAGRPCGFVN